MTVPAAATLPGAKQYPDDLNEDIVNATPANKRKRDTRQQRVVTCCLASQSVSNTQGDVKQETQPKRRQQPASYQSHYSEDNQGESNEQRHKFQEKKGMQAGTTTTQRRTTTTY